MKLFFYPRLALLGIKNNKRYYTPYILAGAVMVMMFFLTNVINASQSFKQMPGGDSLIYVSGFGLVVLAIFSLIFLFYTNTYLIRVRYKELGLYSILGMNKRNLAHIMFWETIFTSFLAILIGCACGALFSKFAELFFLHLVHGDIDYTFTINTTCLKNVVLVYGGIYLLLLVNSIICVSSSKPISLMRSQSVGEKVPKANWLLALIGMVMLIIAYYLAIRISSPLEAMNVFVVAVILVIIATYLLFIAGSVVICKILQSNKHYYYKTNHFVSVSSMRYRMKRNGAGLASICILLTMVLVMFTLSITMYVGGNDAIEKRYPKDMGISFGTTDYDCLESVKPELKNIFVNNGLDQSNIQEMTFLAGTLELNGTTLQQISNYTIGKETPLFQDVTILSLADYNAIIHKDLTLNDNECFIQSDTSLQTISFNDEKEYTVKAYVDDVPYITNTNITTAQDKMYIVVNDIQEACDIFKKSYTEEGYQATDMTVYWYYTYDTSASKDVQLQKSEQMDEAIQKVVSDLHSAPNGFSYAINYQVLSKQNAHESMFTLYGGILMISIVLGTVFLFGAVMLIYYKQISEGLEDQKRFEIMQKVGMTNHEIKRSINSQMLLMLFAPLIIAGCHLAAAFRMLYKINILMYIDDLQLMLKTTGIIFVIFACVYACVYKLTSHAYYEIVS